MLNFIISPHTETCEIISEEIYFGREERRNEMFFFINLWSCPWNLKRFHQKSNQNLNSITPTRLFLDYFTHTKLIRRFISWDLNSITRFFLDYFEHIKLWNFSPAASPAIYDPRVLIKPGFPFHYFNWTNL